ncbi:hypothetical protein GCM10028815_19810 [Mariniluteicoccus flavus]
MAARLVEELDEGPEQWAPPSWLLSFGLVLALLIGAGFLIVPPVRAALAPVTVSESQLEQVFTPKFIAGRAEWGWPHRDSPVTLGAGFCEGAMVEAFTPAGAVWVADGKRRSGVVFAGRFADHRSARAAFDSLSGRYANCNQPRFRVTPLEPVTEEGAVLHGYTVEAVSGFRFGSLRREVRFVTYGNTMAAFVAEQLPTDAELVTAWRASVRHAAGR